MCCMIICPLHIPHICVHTIQIMTEPAALNEAATEAQNGIYLDCRYKNQAAGAAS